MGFVTPILPLSLFILGQIIDIRQKVPMVFKMETIRSVETCLNETQLEVAEVTTFPLYVRLLSLSPNFIGILSLILYFVVSIIGNTF